MNNPIMQLIDWSGQDVVFWSSGDGVGGDLGS